MIEWRKLTWPTCSVYHSAGHGCFPHASWLAGLGSLHSLSFTSNSAPRESSTQNTSRDLTPCSPSLQLFVHSVHSPISHLETQSRHMSLVLTKNYMKTHRPCVFCSLTLAETWMPSSGFSVEAHLRDRWNNRLRPLWNLHRFTNFQLLKIASENIDMYKWYFSKITLSPHRDIKRLQSHLAGHVWVLHSFGISSGLISSQNWSPTADSSSSRTQTAVITSVPGNIKQRADICKTILWIFFQITLA